MEFNYKQFKYKAFQFLSIVEMLHPNTKQGFSEKRKKKGLRAWALHCFVFGKCLEITRKSNNTISETNK